MAGGLLPPQPFELTPLWRNFFEDPGLVQFMHRLWGYALLAFAIYAWRVGRASANANVRAAFIAAFAMTLVQMVLGIVTVLLAAPWWIAIVHQAGAVFLWVLVIRAWHVAGAPSRVSVRSNRKATS